MQSSNRELVFTRLLNAPRELVFEAWTDPKHLAQWYGPDGFKTTTHYMELKPGGFWRFTMHGPDGKDYKNKVIFQEIVKPERLVYKHANDGETEPVSFQTTITFEKAGNKTRLTMRMLFESAEELQRVAQKYGAIEGAHQTLARLDELLGALANTSVATSDREIITTRVFDVLPPVMFKAWTDPGILSQWWGPAGFTNTFYEFDPTPGGKWDFVMHGPDGKDYENYCVFIHIASPRQLVWHHISGPKFYVVTTFQNEAGKTRVIFKMIFNSTEECSTVKKYAVDANEQNFNRLELQLQHLATEAVS